MNTNIIYENENAFVLLDRMPKSERHFLIIPKMHNAYFHHYDTSILKSVMDAIKHLILSFNMEKYNILQNNINEQVIMHCHFHLIEANETGKLSLLKDGHLKWDDAEYMKRTKDLKEFMKNNL